MKALSEMGDYHHYFYDAESSDLINLNLRYLSFLRNFLFVIAWMLKSSFCYLKRTKADLQSGLKTWVSSSAKKNLLLCEAWQNSGMRL